MKNKLFINIILLFSLTIPAQVGAKPTAPISAKKTQVNTKKTAPTQGETDEENLSWKDYFKSLITTQNIAIASVVTIVAALILRKLLQKDSTLYFTTKGGAPITVKNVPAENQKGSTCGYHAVKNAISLSEPERRNLLNDRQFTTDNINLKGIWRTMVLGFMKDHGEHAEAEPTTDNPHDTGYNPTGEDIDAMAINALIENAKERGLLPREKNITVVGDINTELRGVYRGASTDPQVIATAKTAADRTLAPLKTNGTHVVILRTVFGNAQHWIAVAIIRQPNQVVYEWVDSINSDYCYKEVLQLMRLLDDVAPEK